MLAFFSPESISQQDPGPMQWVEFFAGKAEATKAFREAGLTSGRLDILYMQQKLTGMNPMDLLTDAGFGLLDLLVTLLLNLA